MNRSHHTPLNFFRRRNTIARLDSGDVLVVTKFLNTMHGYRFMIGLARDDHNFQSAQRFG